MIAMGVILLTGGDLNGPTVGGVLTIVGFSAFGKHAGNIVPTGRCGPGQLVMHSSVSSGAVQLAHAVRDYPGSHLWLLRLALRRAGGVPPLGGSTVCGHAGGRAEPSITTAFPAACWPSSCIPPLWPSPATASGDHRGGVLRPHGARRAGDPASSAGHDRGGGLRERPGWKKKMDFPYRTSLQSGMGSI